MGDPTRCTRMRRRREILATRKNAATTTAPPKRAMLLPEATIGTLQTRYYFNNDIPPGPATSREFCTSCTVYNINSYGANRVREPGLVTASASGAWLRLMRTILIFACVAASASCASLACAPDAAFVTLPALRGAYHLPALGAAVGKKRGGAGGGLGMVATREGLQPLSRRSMIGGATAAILVVGGLAAPAAASGGKKMTGLSNDELAKAVEKDVVQVVCLAGSNNPISSPHQLPQPM